MPRYNRIMPKNRNSKSFADVITDPREWFAALVFAVVGSCALTFLGVAYGIIPVN